MMLEVSIVVAACRLTDLQASLGGLAVQSCGMDSLEIIVVAQDPAICLDMRAFLFRQRFIHINSRDLGEAWNRGAEIADGKVLLFLRDNFVPAPNLVTGHLALHLGRSDVVGLGKVQPASGPTGLEAIPVEHWLGSSENLTKAEREVSLLESAGHTLSVRRETFRTVGGFETGLRWGAELEWVFRLSERGGVLLRLPGPVGERHRHRGDRDILAEARIAGVSSVELYRRAPGLLPHMELGAFQSGTPAGLRLRCLLLAMGAPPLPLGWIRRLLPDGGSQERWNKFLLSYEYWRGVRQATTDRVSWRALTHAPVILMYHAVGGQGQRAGCYIVPLRRFKRQMAWLRFARYRVLSLETLLDCRREHRLPPARSVVLTFDDGYADNRELAFPVLQKHGFPAIVFLVSARIGGKNAWDQSGELAGRLLLSWADIHEMVRGGMQVGAHTRRHVALTDLPLEEAEQEITGSRADLERELGKRVRAFAYPFGRLDGQTADAVASAGFDGACCSRSGANDAVVSSYLLRRLEVRGTDSLLQFIRAVRWGHRPSRGSR